MTAGGYGGQLRTCWLVSKSIDYPLSWVKPFVLVGERLSGHGGVSPETHSMDTPRFRCNSVVGSVHPI